MAKSDKKRTNLKAAQEMVYTKEFKKADKAAGFTKPTL